MSGKLSDLECQISFSNFKLMRMNKKTVKISKRLNMTNAKYVHELVIDKHDLGERIWVEE
jgi:hypothetical protein